MATLTDLLTPRTREQLEAILLSALQAAPIEGGGAFPVTDWYPGGLERTTLKMIATGLVDREELVQWVTAGGFLDLASTLVDSAGNPIEGWMEMLAEQYYQVTRLGAVYSKQALTLSCTDGPGPYTRAAGELIAYAPSSGNRYLNVASVTIPNNGSVVATFQAESAGLGYNDAMGSIIALITPLPGVSVTNAATPAGTPSSYITGTGEISVISTGITSTPRSISISISVAGRVNDGTAKFLVTTYQGGVATTLGPYTAVASFASGDVTLSFSDGPSSTTSFVAGDQWIVGVPGTSLLQAGAEKESLAALAQRCRDRWPSLSAVPTQGRFEAWVRECSAEQTLGLTKVRTTPSLLVAGQEDIFISGSTATATVDQVAAVQAFINVRVSDIETGVVYAAVAHPVSMNGVVYCKRGKTLAVQEAADLAWEQYIADLPIGGDQPGGLVRLQKLEEILMDAGAFNLYSIAIDGYTNDLILDPTEAATIAADPNGVPRLAMTWKEVA